MKLYQYKEFFTQIFHLPANAANARKIMKEHNIDIIRHDFRCTKTWEMLMYSFDSFKELVELAADFVQRITNPPKSDEIKFVKSTFVYTIDPDNIWEDDDPEMYYDVA